MHARQLCPDVSWVGAIDWDRRLFDALVPLERGTSYNAFVVRGQAKTALVDTVEPGFWPTLSARLDSLALDRLDYVVANHAEQDHSGSLPRVLERYPGARLLCSPRGKKMLLDLLPLPADRIDEVEDGAEVDLGGLHLRFVHFPWVHWPETMLTLVPERRLLLPCDLFGSHWATSELVTADLPRLLAAARSYYAEIMMPLRPQIQKSMAKLDPLELELVAPSHGPACRAPAMLIDAYRDWLSDRVDNHVAIAYVTMHASTERMVEALGDALERRGVGVERLNLAQPDVSRLASALVDAATVVFATPTVLGGVHPNVMYAVYLANLLRPKVRQLGVIGSFGWGSKAGEQIVAALPNLKEVTLLEPVLARGSPDATALAALDRMAETIAGNHARWCAPAPGSTPAADREA